MPVSPGGERRELAHHRPGRTDPAAAPLPIEQMAQWNRERTPERQPRAKGSGALGRFEVTSDVSAYTNAAVFQPGSTTDLVIRFSTVAGERAAPIRRDPRRLRDQVSIFQIGMSTWTHGFGGELVSLLLDASLRVTAPRVAMLAKIRDYARADIDTLTAVVRPGWSVGFNSTGRFVGALRSPDR